MSIASEISRILSAKASLKTAINNKGGNITTEKIDQFASKVTALPSPKEEQTKTVSPTTSSQDVLPDANKVLSKVTVNAIPTETKSQQPNLSSGNQTINATSGKFMTSFTITKDTINHIASNIRSGKTLYGVTGNLQPAKEEETKTLTPNFSSGNHVVTPTSGKVLSQVTLTKPADLIPENIAKDKNVCGVVGTLESGGGGGLPTINHTIDVGSGTYTNSALIYLEATTTVGYENSSCVLSIRPYWQTTVIVEISIEAISAWEECNISYRTSTNSGSSWSSWTTLESGKIEETMILINFKNNFGNSPFFCIKYNDNSGVADMYSNLCPESSGWGNISLTSSYSPFLVFASVFLTLYGME